MSKGTWYVGGIAEVHMGVWRVNLWGGDSRGAYGGLLGKPGGKGRIAEVHMGVWWVNLWERDNLRDLGINGKTILKRIFKK